MRWLSLGLALGMLGACIDFSDQQSAREKFIAFVQAGDMVAHKYSMLHKVHSPAITIAYGFGSDCANKYSDAQVTGDIERVMRLWIQALRDWDELPPNQALVDTFHFVKSPLTPVKEDEVNGGMVQVVNAMGSDLKVTLYCRPGRSFMYAGFNPMQIHLYDEEMRYSMSTLVHEMGHVFGLADTYVDATGLTGGPNRFNQSVCGSKNMVGCQPLSIMNHSRWLIEDDNNLRLGEDDIIGLRWLYRYIFIAKNDASCPQGYVPEYATRGCVPADLLTFARDQGDIDNVVELMIEKNIDLDTKDKDGNTVLHLAAQRAASHGGYVYGRAVEAGASPDLANNAGNTPREILFPAIEEAMRREKIHIAQELIARAID